MEYVISIGSNWHRDVNMQLARVRLSDFFPDIRFSREEETKPLSMKRTDLFSNQVACFVSARPLEEVVRLFKQIEADADRKPEDKSSEVVKLDIDVLRCGGRICKSKDWERDYVRRGLDELHLEGGPFFEQEIRK